MKARIAAVVLAGILCATAPAWSDTISGHSRDFGVVTSRDASEVDTHNAPSVTSLISFFLSDIGKFNFVELQPNHRIWNGWGLGRQVSDPHSPTTTSTPVSTPEPGTLPMLALGLMGLLGSALIVSPSRSRRV
ncbi:MAG: hypothetical protein WA369_12365 [Candidatus Acidiferrales bacterium]